MQKHVYIVPEHNNMQIIIHPDAATHVGKYDDALLKALKRGFFDKARQRGKIRGEANDVDDMDMSDTERAACEFKNSTSLHDCMDD